MNSKKKNKSKKPKTPNGELVDQEYPVWYQPEAPLGSAVRYLASLSSKFNWVRISIFKGKRLNPGPFVGDKSLDKMRPRSQLVVLIRNSQGKNLGQIEVKSFYEPTIELSDEIKVKQVALELGFLWPIR